MKHPSVEPTPERIMETLTAYQRSDALSAAIELDLFGGIAAGHRTPTALAAHCAASERGIRMLCDYLVVHGFLSRADGGYRPAPDAARFLDRSSEHYLGSAIGFLGARPLREGFSGLVGAVRRGGTVVEGQGTIAPDHDVWVEFARGMAPLMQPTAAALADLVQAREGEPLRVLDLAAGHGLFGIEIALRYPAAQVVAVDWSAVLEVAGENARRCGVGDRFTGLPGSIFEVELGSGCDLVLLANILHHFDREQCTTLLSRVREALNPGGRAVLLEYVPDEDRVSPPRAAGFALVMLATTPAGDAYTFSEYRRMLADAGFDGPDPELSDLPDSLHQVIVVTR